MRQRVGRWQLAQTLVQLWQDYSQDRTATAHLLSQNRLGNNSRVAAQRFEKWQVGWHPLQVGGAAAQNRRPSCYGKLGGLIEQPRLADPRLARQQHNAATALAGARKPLGQEGQLPLAPNKLRDFRRKSKTRVTHHEGR